MPHTGSSFIFLEQVDSTNNYAMAKVHAGLAKHGDACFTNHQTEGKGQRGKSWQTGAGENIALSVVLNPKQLNIMHPFTLSVAAGLAAFDFFKNYAGDETSIKWPNDLYWRDRKAGGILIENKFSGKDWNWSVIGVGININQAHFNEALSNPVSLLQITGNTYNTLELAKELYELILKRVTAFLNRPYQMILDEYNQQLFKLQQKVRLKKDNMVFETVVKGVNAQGQLITMDRMERHFDFGEVEWVI